ncbi:MAG: efflux RND transporter periplasmic adaptor subunit [Prevotella sp.]|nr:efflux RND transporter periplasmic adaptor subunit [Prevotella sp.]
MKKNKILLFAVATMLLASCGGGGGRPNFGDNEFPVVTVGTSSTTMQSTYPATIKGVQDVEIHPKVQGFITQVNVKEGQMVSAGQVLFVLDNVTYQAQVRQAQASVNTATAACNTAKLSYENSQKLHENGVIGDFELQSVTNQYEQAKAGLAQAQAALASAKEMLSFCYVKSPAAGVVGSLPFKVGTLVSAANTLTTVSNISSMEVYFSMTEKDVLEMGKTTGGLNGAIQDMPTVQLKLADGTIYGQEGKVTKMSGVIDPATGSVQMIAVFQNPEKLLKSGGSGTVIIPHNNSSAIVVPQSAVSEVQNKKFVYTLGKDNKVQYTEIKVDPQNDGNNYIVTEGLKAGDKYVTNGITKLSDGMEIVPITPERYQQKIQEQAKAMSAGDIVGAMK